MEKPGESKFHKLDGLELGHGVRAGFGSQEVLGISSKRLFLAVFCSRFRFLGK